MEMSEAVSLAELAQHMEQRTWVDLRTPLGPIHRVRIMAIIVRPDVDELDLRQSYLEDDRHCRNVFRLDADFVLRVRPTVVGVDQVRPYGISKPKAPAGPVPTDLIVQAVIESGQAAVLAASSPTDTTVRAKHTAIIVMYEMTDMHPAEITSRVGYKSPMPFQSACWKLRHHERVGDPADKEFVKAIKALGRTVDGLLPGRPRRTVGFAPHYKPVLPR